MELAKNWIRVVKEHTTVIVGVYVPGKGRLVATVHQSRNQVQWLVVLGQLSEGIWFNGNDPKLTRSMGRIEKLLAAINENAGTNFQLVSRMHYGEMMRPEVGLVGG